MNASDWKCISCGCTEDEPCVGHETGEACSWVPLPVGHNTDVMQINGGALCSFCAEAPTEDAGVQIYSDAEANQFLRSRGAGR